MSMETDYSGLNFLKNKGKAFLIDTTNWDSLPPGELGITVDPPADIKVAAGEGKKVEKLVSINSKSLNVEEIMLLSDGNKNDGIDLSFNPSLIHLPLNGTKYTEMIIKGTSKELEPRTYDDISINITRGLINPSNLLDLIEPISYADTVTIQILPPIPPIDKLNNFFLDNYGVSIYIVLFSIPLGITTIFAFILSKRFNPQIILDKIGIQDLLTIDGSVIVGVLILLTLNTGEANIRGESALIAILTTTIIFPFTLSALITLIKGSVELGIKLAIPGFIYLMVSIIIVAYIQYQSSVY
jgi:hypothetical protein